MIKFSIRLGLFLLISAIVFAIFSNVFIISKTSDYIYEDVDSIPIKEMALVLGTSKRNVKGEANSFFDNRMEAAAQLYHKGKVKGLLLSGDNRTRYYNEPSDMKKALMEKGVPERVISIDTAGLRTIESVARCKEVFHHNDVTIITQEFHAFRALYISQYYEMDAIAFPAAEVPVYSSTQVTIREFFARPKALLDLYILNNNYINFKGNR
ncbi:ElyC/SanA/YdcF family protein [Marivirga harenae]|uniref:SanA/YdcF family protein n=1 Tax=Marivirga harenae TaxID=2010992 RepID=UPI0026DFA447|nr:ElyC/SanA/YdcF family protein [Marivirga harenae]WKV11539.1 ElyC/SanA/YdcF family protein [Marivirga harenae]|tara:strand:- start:22816 stop:23445 length:630 start_codon:yes stop_codon:yes gene_type:complete